MTRLAVVLLLVVSMIMTPGAAAAQPRDHLWLALGDSYSSGEGINRTPAARDVYGKDCRRATGEGTKATAWAAGAFAEVREELGFTAIDFVACTGNISDDAAAQIAEATMTGHRSRWDLVTFSFGGNNILFSEVIQDCIKPRKISHTKFTRGCTATESALRERVDMLVGKVPIKPGEFKGTVTLPELYDQVAEHVNPGGDVVVVGYPNLIEEPERQTWLGRKTTVCDGVRAHDVPMLRNVGRYLNQQIAEAIFDADTRHRSRGVRFHFVDIATDPYEQDDDPRNRHARCTKDPWLNGLLLDPWQPGQWGYINRSFHPHQEGHTNTARVIADYLRDNVTFDDTDPPPPPASEPSTPPSQPPSGDATVERAISRLETLLHAVGHEDITTVCEIAGPAAKQAEEQGFGPCERTFPVTFAMISPEHKEILKTTTVDPAMVQVRSPVEVYVPPAAIRPSGTFDYLGDFVLSYQNGDWYQVD